MYPYIDNIFHAQAYANQVACTRDLILVMPHLGFLISTVRGLVFPSLAWTETIVHAAQGLLGLTPKSQLEAFNR